LESKHQRHYKGAPMANNRKISKTSRQSSNNRKTFSVFLDP